MGPAAPADVFVGVDNMKNRRSLRHAAGLEREHAKICGDVNWPRDRSRLSLC
jgi:hypothetical protein